MGAKSVSAIMTLHKNITLEKAKIVNPEVQKAINEHYGFNDEIMYGEEDDD